jgi:8-oxo-dGTP pyrophosphatase MutT (NUDIX family)
MMHSYCRILPGVLVAALTGCGPQLPACNFEGTAASAPSAGCLIVEDRGLLVVESMSGQLSVPGGSAAEGESAQCTAQRETWEETGLEVSVGQRLAVFETGFHLYECAPVSQPVVIDPPPRFEVRRAFFLPAEDFRGHEWRFPEQIDELQSLVRAVSRNGQP